MNFIRRHWIITAVILLITIVLGLGGYAEYQDKQAKIEKGQQLDKLDREISLHEKHRSIEDQFWLDAYQKRLIKHGIDPGLSPEMAWPSKEEIETERSLYKERLAKANIEIGRFPSILQKAAAGDRSTIIQFGEGRYGYSGTYMQRDMALIRLAKSGNPEAQFWIYMNRGTLLSDMPKEKADQIALENLKEAVRKEHPAAIIYWVNDVIVNGLKNPSMATLMFQQSAAAFTYLDSMTSGRAMRVDPLDDVQAKREKEVKAYREELAKARSAVAALKGKGLYSDDSVERFLHLADEAQAEITNYATFKMNRNVVGAALGGIK